MANWIEKATQKGHADAQARAEQKKHMEEALRAFSQEIVDEDAVRNFLDPFGQPVEDVTSELQAEKYEIDDEGYGFYRVVNPNQYALTRQTRNGEDVAYGRKWEIITPSGEHMDTLVLFPLVSESTHFARGYFNLGSGGGCFAHTNDEWNLRLMLGASIAKYIEESER